MQRLGFIHDMLDVKVLILFVMARVSYPVTMSEIYELCYQDDCLSYFDVCTAVPEMVKSGHLQEVEESHFVITEKGKGLLNEEFQRLQMLVEDGRKFFDFEGERKEPPADGGGKKEEEVKVTTTEYAEEEKPVRIPRSNWNLGGAF